MADPVSIAGTAPQLIQLANYLVKLCNEFRYAQKDLDKVSKRTKTVAAMYVLFRGTLKKAERIDELTPIFKRHENLMSSVRSEASHTIKRLKNLTKRFDRQMSGRNVSSAERWIARFRWIRTSNKVIVPLFQDMEVLEQSMRTVGILMNTNILEIICRRLNQRLIDQGLVDQKVSSDLSSILEEM